MTDRSGVFLNSALGATLGSGGAGGLTPTTITGNTTALAGLEYRCNSASQLLVTMPASPADGNKVGVVGIPISGTGGWKLAPNTSQTLWYGQQSTTAGFVGTAASSGVWEYISSASAWRYLYGTSDFTVGAVPGDPFFTNVTLLVPGSGSIQDFSGNARALTNTNVTFSASHTKYAAQNMSFNGSSAKLTDSVQTGYKFPGDFCIEGWVYFNAVNVKQVIFQCGSSTTSATGFYLYLNSTGHLVFNSNSADQITDAGALSAGTFYHIAVSRQGGLVQLFRGTATGASVGTPWASTANFSDGYCFIGADSGSANYLNAFVEGFRVTNGYSRYSANFTVPAVPFYTAADTTADALWQNQVLCCSFDSNFNDSSGNAITLTNTGSVVISNSVFKVGSGSAQFNGGSNSYLSNNTAGNLLPFILGDFSVKFWVFPTIFGSLNGSHLISMGGVANECGLYLSGAIPTVIWNGSLLTSSGGGIPLNTWTEVEFVHVGTTLTLYINGQNVGQATVSASTAVTNISIGANYSQANSGLIGYIDNLEITGFGSPTANFTPLGQPVPHRDAERV